MEGYLLIVDAARARPCAVCKTPTDALWHPYRRGQAPSAGAPGVCEWCAANATVAFAGQRKEAR